MSDQPITLTSSCVASRRASSTLMRFSIYLRAAQAQAIRMTIPWSRMYVRRPYSPPQPRRLAA
jgi:hypothetical protein